MTIFGNPSRLYYKKFAFTVEILGVEFAGFQSCSEIAVEVAKVEHSEGGALIPTKQPGRVTVPDVTLSRGATDDLDLWAWMQQVVVQDSILVDPEFKRSIDVVQRRRNGSELRRWTLVNAWPVRFKAGDWDNEADENTIEEVVLAYDYPIVGGDTNAGA